MHQAIMSWSKWHSEKTTATEQFNNSTLNCSLKLCTILCQICIPFAMQYAQKNASHWKCCAPTYVDQISLTRGQFYQHAHVQLLHVQIPKAQKYSQVISRKKVDNLLCWCTPVVCTLRCALKFDEIDPSSQLAKRHCGLVYDIKFAIWFQQLSAY